MSMLISSLRLWLSRVIHLPTMWRAVTSQVHHNSQFKHQILDCFRLFKLWSRKKNEIYSLTGNDTVLCSDRLLDSVLWTNQLMVT